jgi:hypothetical protein
MITRKQQKAISRRISRELKLDRVGQVPGKGKARQLANKMTGNIRGMEEDLRAMENSIYRLIQDGVGANERGVVAISRQFAAMGSKLQSLSRKLENLVFD